jgi:deoxycytidylate deaminase
MSRINEYILDVLSNTKSTTDNLKYQHRSCVVISSGECISIGTNRRLSNDNTVHAEVDALLKIKRCVGADLVVVRLNKNGTFGNSRPCNTCIAKMKKHGIRKVFYTTNTGKMIWEYLETMKPVHYSSGYLYKNNFK